MLLQSLVAVEGTIAEYATGAHSVKSLNCINSIFRISRGAMIIDDYDRLEAVIESSIIR